MKYLGLVPNFPDMGLELLELATGEEYCNIVEQRKRTEFVEQTKELDEEYMNDNSLECHDGSGMDEICQNEEELMENCQTNEIGVYAEEGLLNENNSSDERVKSDKQNDEELEEKCYTCDKCGVSLKTKRKLRDHIRYHHQDPTDCPLCLRSFPSKEKAKRHMAEVHSEKKSTHLCTMCPRAYSRLENLKRHMETSHSEGTSLRKDKSTLKCNICSKSFPKAKYLNYHIKTKHQVILWSKSSFFLKERYLKVHNRRAWICYSCRTTFKTKFTLTRHYKNVHKVLNIEMEDPEVESKFGCHTCCKTFSTKKSLVKHREMQHPSEAHECYICDKGFAKKCSLYMHKYLDHMQNTNLTCSCGKILKHKKGLKAHQKICGKSARLLKSLNLCTPRQRRKRIKYICDNFLKSMEEFSEDEQKEKFVKLLKRNPNLFDKLGRKFENKFTEIDVIKLVRDVNLSDRQCLKILAKMREKWGRNIITPNISKVLIDTKRSLKHLFTCTLLSKDGPLHFKTTKGEPVTRYLVYCNDLQTLVTMKDVLKEEADSFENIISIDDGKDILKVLITIDSICQCLYMFLSIIQHLYILSDY